ncbi:DUF2147 domain-containing protein [Chryseosolibacter indicus]|uniref:DUF2147 domain-containing protein n=1 Tax=Chryseosolibacter indicus TaxID=2782351 RepID=A0ABS5VZ38_9BACT|nr:DUF2147 domain-containing protein [Chryseosolibacter indicus]MBT1706132.1 DUF2147 domain-containing protein [Chryseosolibacter indicus]
MKLLLPLLFSCFLANGQSIIGKWKTVDDNTGDERSVVEIFQKGDKVYGKIIKLFRKPGEDPDPVCEACDHSDTRFKKKIVGMEIIQDMVLSENEYIDGNILDPQNGKIYKCKLWLEGDHLKVRGYWGPFYRTQTWKKAN